MRRVLLLLWGLTALAPAQADPLSGLRLDDLSATRERPLFRPSRRAPQPAPVAAPAPPPAPVEAQPAALEPPPFDLVGAVVGPHDAIALLRNRATNEVVRLHKGEVAQGWRAATIAMRSVTLERDGRTEALALASPTATNPGAEIAGEPQPADSVPPLPGADGKRFIGRLRPER